jgi:hypothetical protein
VRASWDEVTQLIAAATVHTIAEHGPDRVAGFTPIPAMSPVSFAAGSRFLGLIGAGMVSRASGRCIRNRSVVSIRGFPGRGASDVSRNGILKIDGGGLTSKKVKAPVPGFLVRQPDARRRPVPAAPGLRVRLPGAGLAACARRSGFARQAPRREQRAPQNRISVQPHVQGCLGL